MVRKNLDQLEPKEAGVVAEVSGGGEVLRRLMDMGLTAGAPIKVIKVAPLGDPIEITVRGYELSLRKKDAACITIEV